MHLPRSSFAALLLPLLAFAFCTIFFGGNWLFAQTLTTLLLSLGAILPLTQSTTPPTIRYAILLPLGLTLAWATLQSIPKHLLPPPFNLLPPHPVFALAGTTTWAAISLNPAASWNILAYALTLTLTALNFYHLTINPTHAHHLRLATATIIYAAALYGLLIFATGNTHILWLPKAAYMHDLTATFINRNSFATFCGLGLIACLSIFLNRIGEISSRLTHRQRLKAFWLLILRPNWLWLIPTFTLFTALLLTHSRAGILCTTFGLTTMLLALIWSRPAIRLILSAILIPTLLLIIITFSTIGSPTADRFTHLAQDQSIRHTLNTLTLNAIAQAPLAGQGLGSFPQAFALIRTPASLTTLPGLVEHAHNTYLELATELGLPCLSLLLIAITTTFILLIRGLTLRRRAVIWPATGLAALTLTSTHALFDFSLSIPAVLLATLFLVIPALAQSQRPQSTSQLKPRYFPILLATLTSLFALYQTYALYPTLHHNYALSAKRNPTNATIWQNLATANLTQAEHTSNPGLKTLYQTAAAQALKQALILNPANSISWYQLTRITQSQTALINSILTGPFEPTLTTARQPLEQQALATASPDDAILLHTHLQQLQAMRAKPLGGSPQTR